MLVDTDGDKAELRFSIRIDDIAVSISSSSVSEGAAPATLTFKVTLNQATGRTVTFGATTSIGMVTIAAENNAVHAPNKSVTLRAAADPPAAAAARNGIGCTTLSSTGRPEAPISRKG